MSLLKSFAACQTDELPLCNLWVRFLWRVAGLSKLAIFCSWVPVCSGLIQSCLCAFYLEAVILWSDQSMLSDHKRGIVDAHLVSTFSPISEAQPPVMCVSLESQLLSAVYI